MRLVSYSLGLSLGLAALGCSSSATDTTTIARPELVAVSPDDFLDTLNCGTEAGDVQRYVATLFDVTPASDGGVPNPGFQLASSPPTSCLFQVSFAYVVLDHQYLAQVDAYDRADITPSAPGARVQLDSKGARVAPHWLARCGGYPPTFVDGGMYGSLGGAAAVSEIESAGAPGDPQALISYDGITQTAHDCGPGLQVVTNSP